MSLASARARRIFTASSPVIAPAPSANPHAAARQVGIAEDRGRRCASYPHGFFNAYEAIAAQEGVDLVLHLGDYIYEYGLSGYGGDGAIALGRIPAPEVECKAVEDYRCVSRKRAAKRNCRRRTRSRPWIVVWDDHEVANDSWSGGAENHQPETEGAFAVRKSAALQAYYEWMPIRDPAPAARSRRSTAPSNSAICSRSSCWKRACWRAPNRLITRPIRRW